MIISDAFKNDTLSKNTQLVPLVIIEKFISEEMGAAPFGGEIIYKRVFLSTHNIQVEDNYFKPLLLNVPKISQKIDIGTGKFQVSSVTLDISNVDYNNSKRLSEELESYNLINSVVCIHYKSQSCTKIQLPEQDGNGLVEENTDVAVGCPRIFTGVIRDIKHTKDKITLSLEDITEKKMNKDLPDVRLSSGDNVPDKYKNSYIPMLYGRLENAPTVASYQNGIYTFKADSEPIFRLNTSEVEFEGLDGTWVYNTIKIFSESYVPLTKYVQVDTFPTTGLTDDIHYEITDDNRQQYNINADNSLSFRSSSMFNIANRVEAFFVGKPQSVLLNDNINIHIDSPYTSGEHLQFYQSDLFQALEDSDYDKITDDNLGTEINKNLVTGFMWSNEEATNFFYNTPAHSLVGVFSLQWDSGVSGAKYIRVIRNKINGIRIPSKGDANVPSNHGEWDNQYGFLYISDIPEALEAPNEYGFGVAGDVAQSTSGINYHYSGWNDLISFGTGNAFSWYSPTVSDFWATEQTYNEDADIKVYDIIDPHYNEDPHNYNYPDVWSLIRLADGDNAYPKCGKGWSSMEFFAQCYTDGYAGLSDINLNWTGSNVQFNADIKLKEIDVASIINFDDVIEKNYYLNAHGRTDTFLFEYEHLWEYVQGQFIEVPNNDEVLTNPVDIIRNILVESCNFSQEQFDEYEFNQAWLYVSGGSGLKLNFSINKKIEVKKVLQNIYINGRVFPRFKNNGKLGFIHTKKHYSHYYDYDPATEIDTTDIISYTFGLTPSTDLISKIDVSYDNDYEQDKVIKTTDSMEMNGDELDFYGIINADDNYVNIEAEYITDTNSANNLRNLIWYDKKAQHLEIELVLPLSYINIETGDLCRFPVNQLIDNITAHGINYTIPIIHGGIIRYPLFQVISVIRNLENVKIKLHQLHHLDTIQDGTSHIQNAWNDVWEFNEDEWVDPVYSFSETGGIGYGYEDLQEETIPAFDLNPLGFEFGVNSGMEVNGMVDDDVVPWTFSTSWSREFTISDESMMEYTFANNKFIYLADATDNLNNLFGIENFNNQDFMLDAPYLSSINNYNPLQIEMFGSPDAQFEHIPYILRYQNIAGTEFDEEEYGSELEFMDATIPYNLSEASTEILKLRWVAYEILAEGVERLYSYGADIGHRHSNSEQWHFQNLRIKFTPYGWTYDGTNSEYLYYNSYIFKITRIEYNIGNINENQSFFNTIYNSHRQGSLLYTPESYSDTNPDVGIEDDNQIEWSILHLVTLVNYIILISDGEMEIDAEDTGFDFNEDGVLSILDVMVLLNLIMEGNEY